MKKKSLIGVFLIVAILLQSSLTFAVSNHDIVNAYSVVLREFESQREWVYDSYIYPQYFIYDIDKDGLPEIIVDDNKSEAEKMMHFYKFSGDSAVCLGSVYSGHSTLCSVPNENGVMLYGGHMGYETVSLISIENLEIKQNFIIQNKDCNISGYDEPWEIINGSEYIYSDGTNNVSAIEDYLNKFAVVNGSVCGEVVYTDIAAYINHYPIPAYAYDGGMVVVAEDLRNYGFDVTYDDNTRSLSIVPNRTITTLSGMGTVYKNGNRLGEHFADALKSDINVYFNGSWIPSCAINGYMMIKLEDLASEYAGTSFTWDNSTRSAKLWVDWASITEYNALDEDPSVVIRNTNHSQYVGEWYYTPEYDYRPLIELSISEANSSYVTAYAARTHGKGIVYNIGRADFINSDTAVAYGSLEWAYNGMNIPKKYELVFQNNYIKMNIYDSNGTFEDTFYFYNN